MSDWIFRYPKSAGKIIKVEFLNAFYTCLPVMFSNMGYPSNCHWVCTWDWEYKNYTHSFSTFSVIVTSLEWNIVEHIHALIETRPYKIQTFRIGASGCIFFRNLLSSCTWAIKLNIEKIAAAGSCIPKNRINGHFPWNWGVLR